MCMLFHRNSINYYPQKGKGQPDLSDWPLILCRQRPTLPHTFACSTIGPAGLNFRVRDGNRWIPRGSPVETGTEAKGRLSRLSVIWLRQSPKLLRMVGDVRKQQVCEVVRVRKEFLIQGHQRRDHFI